MSSFAEVAVQGFSNDEDICVFDYIVPDKYKDKLRVGMRVIVPFGNNRRLEGYVINIKESTEVQSDKLKRIESIPDEEEIFSNNQITLAKWISEEYLCSLADSLKCIIPSQMVMKEIKTVILNDPEENTATGLGEHQSRVIETLKNNGNSMDLNLLKRSADFKLEGVIRSLVKAGIISVKSRMNSDIKDKTTVGIVLAVSKEGADTLVIELEKCTRFIGQVKLIKTLLTCEREIAEKELVDTYGISPSSINTLVKKGIILKTQIKVNRDPYGGIVFPEVKRPDLTYEQKNVIEKILSGYYSNGLKSHVIHGVTGSGKTEVYMRLIENIIGTGKQAIMLVPEISLTPQTIERFKGRFKRVAVMHSRLSPGERYDEWRRIKQGEVDVVVGARSAVFAPLDRLGIIILDEEHEYSYKSDKTPKYHAREVAYKRCEIENAMLVLGSATPCIETYHEALQGKYSLCEMHKRVDNKKMPHIKIADMREEMESGNKTIFSKLLYSSILETLSNKEQIILFLNRRGFSTFVSCRKCGLVMKCPRCDVSLTYHLDNNMLSCHYCGYSIKSPAICPSCSSKYIKYFGIGTQKIETEVRKCFPSARVLRMDLDTTSRKGSHERIYKSFKNREADILIGTQMISKGLDFPGVTLVGIIAADMTLNIPDYKSCERTFQLITQVSGRAGRGSSEGKVVVQTYTPDHYSIQAALNNNYIEFYNKEIIIRETFGYPPFSELVNIVISSTEDKKAAKIAGLITERLSAAMNCNDDVSILGPSPAPISKINTFYRWQTIIKGNIDNIIKHDIKSAVNSINMKDPSVKINIDVNPVSIA